MQQSFVFDRIVGVCIQYLQYVLNCISGWGCQVDARPQTSQYFGAVEVHDPIGVCVILFWEFDFRPFSDKVGQYLRFNGSPGFVCYVEWGELNGPFGNPARGVAVVYNIIKWHFGGYCNRTLLKVVSQLPGCHEYRIGYL